MVPPSRQSLYNNGRITNRLSVLGQTPSCDARCRWSGYPFCGNREIWRYPEAFRDIAGSIKAPLGLALLIGEF